jgi:hypothetical protein
MITINNNNNNNKGTLKFKTKNEVIIALVQAFKIKYNATKIFKPERHFNYANDMKKRHHIMTAGPAM